MRCGFPRFIPFDGENAFLAWHVLRFDNFYRVVISLPFVSRKGGGQSAHRARIIYSRFIRSLGRLNMLKIDEKNKKV